MQCTMADASRQELKAAQIVAEYKVLDEKTLTKKNQETGERDAGIRRKSGISKRPRNFATSLRQLKAGVIWCGRTRFHD